MREWAVNPAGMVRPGTVDRIAALFRRLAMLPGPSKVARTVARRNGWVPPLAWDDIDSPDATPCLDGSGVDVVDELLVERALAGDRVELTDAELVAALQMGAAHGVPVTVLAARFGLNAVAAKRMVAGELPPARLKRRRVVEVLRACPGVSNAEVARRAGVGPELVARVRREGLSVTTSRSA